jgi:hypothetical protein
MTVYSGKDCNIYFNEKKTAAGIASFVLARRTHDVEDYQSNIHTYPLISQVTGKISSWDRGVNMDYMLMPYKYIDSATDKIIAKDYTAQAVKTSTFNTIGDWQFITTDYQKSFGATYADQEFYLYTKNLLPGASNYTIKQVGVWIKGIGTPNSATYKLQLLNSSPSVVWDSNSDEAYLYTWTSNDDAWIWSDVTSLNLSAHDTNKYKLRLIEHTSTASTDNCVVAYSHSLGSPPNLYGASYTLVCNILLSNFAPTKQVFDIKVSIDSTWSVLLKDCRFRDVGREYVTASLALDEIEFIADSWEWYQE